MFQRLQNKWGVSAGRVLLILCTFAIGGSLCGWAARHVLGWIAPENDVARVVLYIILVTVLWPMAVLLISIPFGQFHFFRKYLVRLGRRMTGRSSKETTTKTDSKPRQPSSNKQLV